MKFTKLSALFTGAAIALAASQASAHDIYIWPSYFSLNSDKATTVPVDITASHTTFRPDFAMSSDGAKVFGVDGKQVRRLGAYFEGARRATFDLNVDGEGTYALVYESGPTYFSSYTIGKRDTKKFMRGKNKVEAQAEMPEEGKNLETSKYFTVAMSYVTNKAPTDAVMQPKNHGFEVIPVTHPADYVTGEEIEVKFLFDGKPAADTEFTIEKEGPQYQEKPTVLELKTDAEGKSTFTFEEGGRYMLKVYDKRDSLDDTADFDITRVYYAFEVIYE